MGSIENFEISKKRKVEIQLAETEETYKHLLKCYFVNKEEDNFEVVQKWKNKVEKLKKKLEKI